MDIYNYIDKYGNKTFEEEQFNEIDSVLFSFLSYANFENILDKSSKKSIRDIAESYQKIHNTKDKNIYAVKEANKLLKYIADTKRYKNCIVYNYEYIGNEKIQFGAISIEYMPNKVYVSFEGTDQLFSGWIEDFIISYKFPTISHKTAIRYLNKNFTFNSKELIVGGHSKGGNLALVAGMNANIFVRRKIKLIYNMDGPGLLDKEFNSKKYKKINNKYVHIIPDTTYIGLFLNHSNDYVVKSSNKGILSHAINFWMIEDKKLIQSDLSPMSTNLDIRLKEWLEKYNKEDKYNFVTNLNDVLKKAEVTSILELTSKNKKIFTLIKETKEINNNTKEILIDFINLILDCFKNTKKEEFKDYINNIFKNDK